MARLEIEPYWRNKSRDVFSGPQKRLVEAWAYGFHKTDDLADHFHLSEKTVKRVTTEIRSIIGEDGPGSDRVAKAVSLAAQNGWINPEGFPDKIERRLTDREQLMLTYRALGLTRNELSTQFKIPEEEVAEKLDTIQKLVGVDSDYGVIAWAILKVLNKKAK